MIRRFEERDTERVMRIWLEGNLGAHDFIPEAYWRAQYAQVQEQIAQAEVFVYEENGNIRGFAGMTGSYLAGIFVDQTARSRGIGKEILGYLKEHYPVFTLHVYRKNQRAVDFYLREGLQIVEKGMDEETAEADYTMQWK